MILDIPNDSIHIEFKQTFPNNAGIFENGGMSGQAFTTQDIDVYMDTDKDILYVFGNGDIAYIVHSPNYEMIFNDILKRNICTAKNCIRYWKEKDK